MTFRHLRNVRGFFSDSSWVVSSGGELAGAAVRPSPTGRPTRPMAASAGSGSGPRAGPPMPLPAASALSARS